MVKHKAEEGRVAVRNLRRAARHELEGLEHDGDLSSDDVERAEKELDKLTQEKVAALDGPPRPQRAGAARTVNPRPTPNGVARVPSGATFSVPGC